VDGTRAVLRVLRIFAFVPFFWMLFDQKASAWVLQARTMDLKVGPYQFEPAQLQFINPALVMILIPLTTTVLYPALTRAGLPFPPLRRMVVGMFLAALSFVMIAAIEARLQTGARPSVLWQIPPYVALTLGEVLVSVSGLELAYAEAPAELKSTIQSLWHLTVFAGNLIVAVVTRLNVFTGVASFLFYASLITVAGVGLAVVAQRSGVQAAEIASASR
jgi:POT family proton-dependent oligopeptide transporter